jgi:ABC-type branched-subunit amino acid transport system substrate-binding protein
MQDDLLTPPQSPARRLFLQRSALMTGMAAVGAGSYVMLPTQAWAAEPIKVGFALDLTGPISVQGIPGANVAKMLIEEINAGGGVLGRPLQMFLEDTATNEGLAVTRVRKLVQSDDVDVVIGGITSSMRNAIKDTIVSRGRKLYLYPQLYEGKECQANLYCTGPTPAQQCDTFIPWLIQNTGKKFFYPGADYIWPRTLNGYARRVAEKAGAQTIGEEYSPVDRTEYAATVAKIMSSGVDVVFTTLIPPGLPVFIKQLHEAGFMKRGGRVASVLYDESTLRISSSAEVEGLASCLDYFRGVNDPFSAQLHEKYSKLFGNTNPLSAAGGSTGVYRAVKLWEAAVKEAGSVKRDDVAKALDHAKITQGPGGGAEMVPGTRHVRMNMYIGVAKGGKYEVVEKSPAYVEPHECGNGKA